MADLKRMNRLGWMLCLTMLSVGCQALPHTSDQDNSKELPLPVELPAPLATAAGMSASESSDYVEDTPQSNVAASQNAVVPTVAQETNNATEAEEHSLSQQPERAVPSPQTLDVATQEAGSVPPLQQINTAQEAPASLSPPKFISLHLEDADINTVLRALGDAIGINFLVGHGVKSQVTLKVDKLPVTEAWSVFQAILNANNLIAVKEGQLYKILPGPLAQKQAGSIKFGRDAAEGEEFYTQIIPLQHLTASGIAKVFEPLIGQGRVVAHQETNTLILSGPASVIKETLQMVKTLDIPGRKRDVPQVFIYYVANAKASEMAGVLQTVFSRKGMPQSGQARPILTGQDSSAAVPIPPMAGVGPEKPDDMPASMAHGESDEGRVVGEVRIVPDERTNALIVKATAHDYEIVKETIKKLDILPRQVIIEILVAEVALSDNFNLGIEWFIKTGMFAFSQSFGLGAASGLVATFVDSNDVRAFLTTLSTFTKINIVTSPHLMARDNKAARMQIGQEVPIVTGSQSTLTGVSAGGQNVFQTIQQRDIGRILNITPHVTEKRQVTLDINLEISDTLPSSTVRRTPSFSKRSINSSVVVEDRQTLMIGGIIDKSTNSTRTGLPWLKDIPYIGFLFGTTGETTSRSELLILLTPHVVGNPEDGIAETKRFKERLEMLQKEMRAVMK